LGAPAEPATELGRAIAAQVRALLAHEVGLRLAPEHEDRVAMRRLRAYLCAAGPLLDESWPDPLRDELQELGRTLGEARDLDVLIEHFEAEVARLDEPAGATLVARLRSEREALQPALLESLGGERWHGLLDRLELEPPLREGPGLGSPPRRSGSACASRRSPPPTSQTATGPDRVLEAVSAPRPPGAACSRRYPGLRPSCIHPDEG
jgi:hypothetical protein